MQCGKDKSSVVNPITGLLSCPPGFKALKYGNSYSPDSTLL